MGMQATINSDTVVVAIKNQVFSNLGEEAVILHLGKGAYYGVNEVGALVWNLLQKPVRVDDIVEAVTGKYEVRKECCLADTLELLQRMLRAKLIEISRK